MHCHTVKQYTKLFYNALFFYKYVNYFDYSAEQCNIGAELFILQQVNTMFSINRDSWRTGTCRRLICWRCTCEILLNMRLLNNLLTKPCDIVSHRLAHPSRHLYAQESLPNSLSLYAPFLMTFSPKAPFRLLKRWCLEWTLVFPFDTTMRLCIQLVGEITTWCSGSFERMRVQTSVYIEEAFYLHFVPLTQVQNFSSKCSCASATCTIFKQKLYS